MADEAQTLNRETKDAVWLPVHSLRYSFAMMDPFLMLKRFLATIFLLLLTAVAAHAQGAAGSKSILLLYSYNHGAKGVDIFDEGLLDTLYASGFKVNDLYFEYLDLERNKGDAEYLHHWQAELERKYPEGKIDLVFAARPPAMHLLMKEGNKIAPGAPVISFQTPLPTGTEAGNRKVYCVVSEFDVAGTITDALSAFPKTKKVLVVAGDSEADRMAAKSVEKAGEQFKGRLEFEYTTGKTYDEVLKRASSTAPGTVILFTQFNRDAAGKVTVAYEVEAALIKAANAPVFGLYDFNLRNGGVGGSVMGVHNLGVETAKLMVEVLEGKAKDSQQVNKVNFPTIHMFDWDQIVKWGGSPQKLPPGSVFKNRSPTLFEAYGWYILGFSLILVLQAVFIAILLEARRRKLYAEAKQQESESFRRAIFDCSRLPIVVMDRVTHRFLDCNPAAVVSYGFGSLEETLGKTPLDVSAPTQYNNETSAEATLRHIEQAAQDGSEVFEWRHRRPDGTEWDAEVHLLNFEVAGVKLLQFSLVDITERKLATEELRISEERNRQIIHSSIDGFWRIDTQARLIEVNDAYCRMSGYSREELLTMVVPDLEALESSEDVAARIRRIVENGSDRFTTSHRRKDGRIFEVEVSIQYRSGEDGGEFAVFLRDVTEKRHLESQLRQAQKLEAIGTLAGGIAHDFNNILGAILGYAEIIRDDFPPGSPSIHDINQVINASHRAKDLVKQILAFSRQGEDQKIPVQPAVIVKEAIALLRSSLPTTITIKQDIDPDAGMILAVPTQIHQIVMNLSTNAFHAMEVKGGTLTISLQKKILSQEDLATEPDLQPGTFVQLSIRDTGEGILPEIRERIFDPFFTTKEVGKGTGLGLSTVYSIVKGSGGSIACDSRLGEGAEFRIILPVLEGHTLQENESAELTPHGKEHILLIDDEEMLVELGQVMLERLGYHVTTRRNSLDALTTFQNQPDTFDLIITDQTMPGMTGVDLARRILQIRPSIPIILCTGYSSQISKEKAKSYGIKGFALKPLAKKDIAVLIRKLLDEVNKR